MATLLQNKAKDAAKSILRDLERQGDEDNDAQNDSTRYDSLESGYFQNNANEYVLNNKTLNNQANAKSLLVSIIEDGDWAEFFADGNASWLDAVYLWDHDNINAYGETPYAFITNAIFIWRLKQELDAIWCEWKAEQIKHEDTEFEDDVNELISALGENSTVSVDGFITSDNLDAIEARLGHKYENVKLEILANGVTASGKIVDNGKPVHDNFLLRTALDDGWEHGVISLLDDHGEEKVSKQ